MTQQSDAAPGARTFETTALAGQILEVCAENRRLCLKAKDSDDPKRWSILSLARFRTLADGIVWVMFWIPPWFPWMPFAALAVRPEGERRSFHFKTILVPGVCIEVLPPPERRGRKPKLCR